MAIHVVRVRAGFGGLLIAGVSFIFPAALLVVALAWAYVRYGALPQVATLLYGVKPVVIVIIAQGAYRLVRSAVKSPWLSVLGAMALAASALGVDPLASLFGAGVLAALVHLRQEPGLGRGAAGVFTALATSSGVLSVPFSLAVLFLVMLKIGATLFGGGYVLVAFLRSDLVTRLHWLTERQLLDAVAAGQVTPGPLFTTATFIGYVLGGVRGAVVATIGICRSQVTVFGARRCRTRWNQRRGVGIDGCSVSAIGAYRDRQLAYACHCCRERRAAISLPSQFRMAHCWRRCGRCAGCARPRLGTLTSDASLAKTAASQAVDYPTPRSTFFKRTEGCPHPTKWRFGNRLKRSICVTESIRRYIAEWGGRISMELAIFTILVIVGASQIPGDYHIVFFR